MTDPAAVLAAARAHMDGPFRWGVNDCCTSAADTFNALFGIDPMRGLRGAYNGRKAARDLMAQRGGLKPLLRQQMAASGLVAGRSTPGAVCVLPGGSLTGFSVGILIDRDHVAAKGFEGLTIINTEPRECWACV